MKSVEGRYRTPGKSNIDIRRGESEPVAIATTSKKQPTDGTGKYIRPKLKSQRSVSTTKITWCKRWMKWRNSLTRYKHVLTPMNL